MRRVLVLIGLSATLAASGPGCSLAPKSFRDMIHTSPIVRARSIGFGEGQPEWVAVPAMIEQLNDPDRVVRMTAHDALKARTKRDFGFIAWAPAEERVKAVERWRVWWKDRAKQAAFPKDDDLRRVSTRPDRGKKVKPSSRRLGGGQGGPTASWPASNPPASDPTPTSP